jgi:hypothetical protein
MAPLFGLRLLAIVMLAFVWLAAFCHCNVCLCLVYGFWPLRCLLFFGLRLLAIVMFAFVCFTLLAIVMLSRKPKKGKHHNGQE